MSNSVILFVVTLLIGISTFEKFLVISNSFSIILSFIQLIPSFIQGVVVGRNSLYRLDNFFSESFVYKLSVLPSSNSGPFYQENKDVAIQLKNARFSWTNDVTINNSEESIKLTRKERETISSKK